jgi:murein DD-endopeptidase MepM/ murein hydrolase activator NlpD
MKSKIGGDRPRCLTAAGVLLLVCVIAGCADDGPIAVGRDWPQATYYTVVVRPADTIPSLADRYDVAPVAVAELNHLALHTRLDAGKVLRIPAARRATQDAVLADALGRTTRSYSPPMHAPSPTTHAAAATVVSSGHSELFAWPVEGQVVSPFGSTGDGKRNDGINIAAELGQPIRAAAAGTVTYAGNELKSYGNLILITHANGYVTAYAHAQSIAVTRGDRVGQGQVIGTAGTTGGVDRPQLHFEIRHGVKPIDPRLLLAASR